MKPDERSNFTLSITRSKAKMFEYDVPQEAHINLSIAPERLLSLTVGLLGYCAARINDGFLVNDDFIRGSPISPSNVDEADLETDRNEAFSSLGFAAFYFDAFQQTHLAESVGRTLLVLGSAAYYLCDYPGSSTVLARALSAEPDDAQTDELESSPSKLLILALVGPPFTGEVEFTDDNYRDTCRGIVRNLRTYAETGDWGNLNGLLGELRAKAHTQGNADDLLFSDVACAIIRKRVANSTWARLPGFTTPETNWRATLRSDSFLKELWPSQLLLGENGLYRGNSAVIQMPTSAGKTRAIEIILRSAFLSDRTQLAVVVAPFRALCHEIRHDLARQFTADDVRINEVSDVFQFDVDLEELAASREVMIVTPEKLLYLLRHNPELAERIGLIIYDEGHQFDTGLRGVTYELLLTNLKALIPATAQTILISAVLSNAREIADWLIGPEATLVSGTNINPTYRTIGFTSWPDQLGQIQFSADRSVGASAFFVPRVLRQHDLGPLPGKRARLLFPFKGTSDSPKSIALFLGLTLSGKGNVAIFCGKKDQAVSICELADEIYARGIEIPRPSQFCNDAELNALIYQTELNLGADSVSAKVARLGVFQHHGDVPHGLRISIEHALKKEFIRLVVCTSTLAQGVNLPIRYLLVSGVHQSRARISVRDFHNLLGRAGRAGMHTEGSVIFADPLIFDDNKQLQDRVEALRRTNPRSATRLQESSPLAEKWNDVQNLLNPERSERCGSSILFVFKPLERGRRSWPIDSRGLTQAYVNGDDAGTLAANAPASVRTIIEDKDLREFFQFKIELLARIESFMISQWSNATLEEALASAEATALRTLAFQLADIDQKTRLVSIFQDLARHIHQSNLDSETAKAFGRSLLNIRQMQRVREWTQANLDALTASQDDEAMLTVCWSLLEEMIQNKEFRKCNNRDSLLDMARSWIAGTAFSDIFSAMRELSVRFGTGPRPRHVTLEHVIELCEQALAFDGMLILAAIREALLLSEGDHEVTEETLSDLQRRIRHGVSSRNEAMACELGFADRHLARQLSQCPGVGLARNKEDLANRLAHSESVERVIERWPNLFSEILHQL